MHPTVFRGNRGDRVIPLAVEAVVLKVDGGHFPIGDLYAFRILVFVEAAVDVEARSGLG